MLTVKPAIKEVWASLSWIFREGKDHFSQRIKKGSSELSPKGWGKMGQVSLEWKDTLGRENGKSKELCGQNVPDGQSIPSCLVPLELRLETENQ